MHRIFDSSSDGIAKWNFNMFRKLCGDESLNNVVVVTNMWDEIDQEIGNMCEGQLYTGEFLFKPVFAKKAKMTRHNHTVESAEARAMCCIAENYQTPDVCPTLDYG